jgi:hypothetical protein
MPMIDYNSKFFTFFIIGFLIFLLYKNGGYSNGSFFPSDKNRLNSSEKTGPQAVFSYTIDPSKPKSFIDTMLLNLAEKDKLAREDSKENKPISLGDKVELLYRTNKDNKPNRIKTVIGSRQLPEQIEKFLIGLKVGDIREIEIDKTNNSYKNIEIISVESFNRITPKDEK